MSGNVTKYVASLKRMRGKLSDGRHWVTVGDIYRKHKIPTRVNPIV